MASFTYNDEHEIGKIPCNTDAILHPKLMAPLDIRSGTSLALVGYAGSGKTNLLFSMFSTSKTNKKTKEKMNLRGIFDRIIIVSPSLKSMTKHCFQGDDIIKFETLADFLESYEEILEDDEDNDMQTAVILDDVGSSIRSKDEVAFNKFYLNRRHIRVCVFTLLQQFSMISPMIRNSLNILISFLPHGIEERERVFSFTGLHKRDMISFYKQIFTKKYDSVLIDLRLQNSNKFLFYKNLFNPITILL